MKSTVLDRERDKFRQAGDLSKVAVEVENNPLNPVIVNSGAVWDAINVTFPANNQDLFTYLKSSVVVQTVLVTYSGPDKKQIVSIQKENL
jgi:hypothetical protein